MPSSGSPPILAEHHYLQKHLHLRQGQVPNAANSRRTVKLRAYSPYGVAVKSVALRYRFEEELHLSRNTAAEMFKMFTRDSKNRFES